MPAPLIPRDEVARRLFGAFTTYGYEGTTLARLSAATGLGRASLYHYFPDGKEAMLREVLGVARDWIRDAIAIPLQNERQSPEKRLRVALANIDAGYDSGMSSCLVNIAGLGDAAGVAGDDLKETASAYVGAFVAFLTAHGVSQAKAWTAALDTVLQIEGALVMARAMNDRTLFTKRLALIEKQLLATVR